MEAYAGGGHRRVQGWLSESAVALVLALGRIQAAHRITGPVGEIGVHHGRFFILLHLLTDGSERSVAWDLFENQDQNLDKSGKGDHDALMKNLEQHQCDLPRIAVNRANSLDLTPAAVLQSCGGPPRIFSVDGGHTAEITFHDLSLAAGSICDDGLIVLDDFFNESWPGVAEGTCRYLSNPAVPLFPVAIGGNKFVFTKSASAARMYQDEFELPDSLYQRRNSVVFDQPVAIFTRRAIRVRLLRAIRRSTPWRAARRLKRYRR